MTNWLCDAGDLLSSAGAVLYEGAEAVVGYALAAFEIYVVASLILFLVPAAVLLTAGAPFWFALAVLFVG
jgi:hypothetical protein